MKNKLVENKIKIVNYRGDISWTLNQHKKDFKNTQKTMMQMMGVQR